MKKISKMFFVLRTVAIVFLTGVSYAQQSYTFTNAGAVGPNGPSQAQVNTAYSLTSLAGSVTVSSGIQQFTIPVTGGYRIEARGAQGYGSSNGGRGAIMIGDFTLTAGTVLKILVGQQGILPSNSSYNAQFGGGGGSFVTYTNNAALVVAGGGGGSHASSFQASADGTTSTAGNPGSGGTTNGTGGTNGGGGSTGNYADGGGGLTGNGGGTAGGVAFTSGGAGGVSTGEGGFGGGGGTSSYNNTRGAGGGGYSGGGGSHATSGTPSGGGGGSFNGGVNQTNTSGANLGHGMVIITELCNISLTAAGASNSLSPVICAGTTLTLTTNAVSNYSWSTGVTGTNQIVITPSSNTTIAVYGTSSLSCQGQRSMSITVSSSTPVISVSVAPSTSVCLGDSISVTATGALTYTYSGGITPGVKFVPAQTTTITVGGTNGCGTASASATVTVTPLVITASASSTLVCANNISTLTATGAQNYTWLPTNNTGSSFNASPSSNTTYTVIGRTGGCYGQSTIQVNTKPNPVLSVAGTETDVCNGESVNLTASGATTYSWTWQGGSGSGSAITVTPSAPTAYNVYGTAANGCVGSAQYIVLWWPQPSLTVAVTPTQICVGATVSLNVSGANSYLWGHGPTTNAIVESPLVSTSYEVTGTESAHGCTASIAAPVEVYQASISVSQNTAVCPGSTVVISAGSASSYTWSSGGSGQTEAVSPSSTTIYTVEATGQIGNMTCLQVNTVQVTVHPAAVVTASANRTTICRNESSTLTASGVNTYSWNTGATTSVIVVKGLVAGTLNYTVSGVDQNNCKDTHTLSLTVSNCNGLNERSGDATLKIYPNPSNGVFTVEAQPGIELYIINELGQKIRTYNISQTSDGIISILDLPKGVYVVFVNGVAEANTRIIVE